MQKIIGPYEVLEQLGSGGMGVVYRARDTRLQREVAIKVLSETFLGPGTPGQATHERFLREARSASSLNHPNICTIYDVGEQDSKPYLVMELLQGRTLKELLRGTPLPLPEALEFSIQIARGLEEAHEAGIVHRDIKPANIFIVRKQQGTQQAKILDFGLAKQTRPQSANGVSDATSDSTGIADTAAGNSLTLPGIDRRHRRLHVSGAGARRIRLMPAAICFRSDRSSTKWRRGSCRSRAPRPPMSSPRSSCASLTRPGN